MDYSEANKLSIPDITKRIKTRSGRIAELQVEVKILDMVLQDKVAKATISGLVEMGPRVTKPEKLPASVAKSGSGEPQTKIKDKSSPHAFEETD